jgi:deoxyribonuclease-4
VNAHRLGANTLQIFSSSPKTWRASTPDPQDCVRMRRVREQLDLKPLVIHTNYLINLAAVDPAVRQLSVKSLRGELERARAIGAEYLVLHPGSYKDQPLEQALLAVVQSLLEAAHDFEPDGVMLLLECTAGSGAAIGSRLEELHALREVASQMIGLPIGFCLDTCHLYAAGFDISKAEGLKATAALIDEVLGWEHVKVVHSNDSKGGLGSRIDRHANVGDGCIGRDGFRRILTHPKFRELPFILETPMDTDELALRDLATLRELAARKKS